MKRSQTTLLIALVVSVLVHGSVLLSEKLPWFKPLPPQQTALDVQIELPPPPPPPSPPQKNKRKPPPTENKVLPAEEPSPAPAPAYLDAPAPPSAEEWQLASTYTPRNGKRYRNAWGKQVRSMMGRAVAGPDQGQVRFRITINPDGSLAQIEELWSTSKKASELAMQAIRNMPPLPPTPDKKPLVFEQTISFLPYETGWPPSYTLDCLPEPEGFKNPYAWNGASPPKVEDRKHRPPPPEGCPPDSTAETIEEEEQSFNRQMDQWRWGR